MTEKEKKAIEFIKDLILWDVRQDLCPNKEECENLETILNLIEKLQKENEYNKFLLDTNNNFIIDKKTGIYKWNVIEIKKLKDIIDRIDYDIKKTKEIISKNKNIFASYRKNDYQIVRLRAMNTKSLDIKKRLQELIEGKD